jgi:peptide/nickel transport system substrate-binding protein
MWAAHQFYNTLVEVDEQLNIKPALAKSWEITEDRKTFIFNLERMYFFMMINVLLMEKAEKW